MKKREKNCFKRKYHDSFLLLIDFQRFLRFSVDGTTISKFLKKVERKFEGTFLIEDKRRTLFTGPFSQIHPTSSHMVVLLVAPYFFPKI